LGRKLLLWNQQTKESHIKVDSSGTSTTVLQNAAQEERKRQNR